MTLRDWFDEQSVDDDIEEIHSIYRAVADNDRSWGYDVLQLPDGRYSITDSNGNKALYSQSDKSSFLEWLDAKYGDELGVEARREMLKDIHKDH